MVAKFNLWVTISKYCNPEVVQSPGYDTQKLSYQAKWKLLWFHWVFPRNFFFEQYPGNQSWKLFTKNFLEKLNEIIVVFLLLRWTISGYRNLEIVQLPSYDIRRLHNIRILLPGGCATYGLQYPKVAQYPGIVTRRLNFATKS